jgi:phosphoglycolate phosphatase
VREALFSILAPEMKGAEFLDLFAGSGAVGLEALSRGAASATFVESSRRHMSVLLENLRMAAGRESRTATHLADAYRWVASYSGPGFTIGFADPPYALGEERGYADFLRTLAERGVIRPDGLFVAEMTAVQKAEETPGWDLLRDRKYGKTRLCVWRRLAAPSARAWFFDLDGTLADTDGDIRGAWRSAMAEMGVSNPNFERDFVAGPPIEEMARRLFPEIYTDAFGAELRARFGAHYDSDGFPTTREYPGVIERVRELKASGARVFIATNKRYAGAKAMWEKFGWGETFEGLYAGDMYKDDPAIGKLRKPQLLKRVMREKGLAPGDCVMVGDTASDFEAASENGMESVGVTWGYGTEKELAMATRIARTPSEI